ncbi:IS256 family transposase [Actinotignum sanguinis]|nr:IS256 family transposase [Actinotignum sanguinis]MDE1578170.1 IS256 family transposase [Actinotignum sanguinis]MDE1643179.1 IS256 family transposase [Actinotignum sanguinis]
MTMTDARATGPESPARALRREFIDDDLLDRLVESSSERGIGLTGENGFLPELIKAVLERGMQAELTDHLGYEKHDRAGHGSGNSRNGTSPKTLQTQVGPVRIDQPRDRAGTFTSRLVPPGQRRMGGLDDMIISLYAGGMTIREIQHHLEATIGTQISHETISNITEAVQEEVIAWQTRPLEAFYPVLFLDAIHVKIKDHNRVASRAAHIAIGVDCDGIKHVLGIWVQAHEGAKFWAGVCAELANRGVQDVLIVACDGLAGFPEAITATWPRAIIQTCVVHLIRASMRFVSYQDRKAVAAALKPIYTAPNEEGALGALEAFKEGEWGRKYPAAVAAWQRAWDRFIPFLAFGPATRKAIYTTNSIESLNYQLRKIIKNRGHFPSDGAAVKLMWLAIMNIEDKRARQRARDAVRPKGSARKGPGRLIEGQGVQGWQKILGELSLHYPDRFPTN